MHSQGTIIGANAMTIFALGGGALPNGSSATFFGPAISELRARTAWALAGGNAASFKYLANPYDPVPLLSLSRGGPLGFFFGVYYAATRGFADHSAKAYFSGN